MLAIRYIFVTVFCFNLLVLADKWLGGARFLDWPTPTLSEMALTAMVIVLTARPMTVYVNSSGSRGWDIKEHVEV